MLKILSSSFFNKFYVRWRKCERWRNPSRLEDPSVGQFSLAAETESNILSRRKLSPTMSDRMRHNNIHAFRTGQCSIFAVATITWHSAPSTRTCDRATENSQNTANSPTDVWNNKNAEMHAGHICSSFSFFNFIYKFRFFFFQNFTFILHVRDSASEAP